MIVIGQAMGAAIGAVVYLLATGELHGWIWAYAAGMLAITAPALVLEGVLREDRKKRSEELRRAL